MSSAMHRTYVRGVAGLCVLAALSACGGDDTDPGAKRTAEAADVIWQDIVNDGGREHACELYAETGNVVGDERYDEFSVDNGELIDALRDILDDECD